MEFPDGNVKVISSSKKKKHEKRTNDSRASITMYCTGCVSGKIGAMYFLLKGQRCCPNYSDGFLVCHDCRKGSTIIMNPNSFMTIEAWEEIPPHICDGLYKINWFVKVNPHWFMLDIVDGFGAHMSSVMALKICLPFRIFSLKEEGYTSHVNQSYNKFVAKSNKLSQSYSDRVGSA